MREARRQFQSIDEYIAACPEDVRPLLEQVRETIRKAAPAATETISYGMPAFRMDSILVYFAAATHHIGFYPTRSGIEAFKSELSGYKWSKGAVKFPIGKPIPLDLIDRMVRFRVREVTASRSKATV